MTTLSQSLSEAALHAEFDRQIDTLLRKRSPEVAGLSEAAFLRHVTPLADQLDALTGADTAGQVPFVVVVSDLLPRDQMMPLVDLAGKPGFTSMDAADVARFSPIEGVDLPARSAYLVADLDTGRATLNVTPDTALPTIFQESRSPLTIDEAIALVTQYPELLRTHNCFSILGSRCGDRRVPAIWISRGSPRLGWCWAGNPHTWLGSASCGRRIGA